MILADDLTLQPNLVLVFPFEHEGESTVPGTEKVIYLDHHWDATFGYAFGTVLKVATNVTDVASGDFVTFVRHAYVPWTDGDGDELLFLNIEDIEGVIAPGTNEVRKTGEVAEAQNRVERHAA